MKMQQREGMIEHWMRREYGREGESLCERRPLKTVESLRE